MTLPELSIRRPVLATVANLLIIVIGFAAFRGLPTREYPDIDIPIVSVSTTYFGASPQTIENSITEPLEQALNGIEDVRTISSNSAFSGSQITIEFEAGRDIDLAATDVTNAVQRALGELPDEAETPVVSKASAGGSGAIMWIGVLAEDWSPQDVTDLADRMVKTPLQLIPGVARIMLSGERRYTMRIWLDPAKMASRGVDPSDVLRTIRENNLQAPAGELEGSGRKFTINIDSTISDPSVFERLVIRSDGDATVRISDVGWVELGSSNYSSLTRMMATPGVACGVITMSTANELDVSDRVHAELARIAQRLPEGVELKVGVDNTIFVRESLKEAFRTLMIVFALVMLVNLIFLRSLTTTLIVGIAIPVSLIGAGAAMSLFGFSINVLTVLGLILAIGMLVDDSIVVLENIYRRQELGESPLTAARNGAREVAFPVLATSAAVVAVLVPMATIAGNTGKLFREFAWTMAAAVIISTFVSLTAVPMACALFLRLKKKHGAVYNAIEAVLNGVSHTYDRTLAWALRHRVVMALTLVAILFLTGFLFRAVPSTLAPIEDRGGIMTMIRAPQGSTAAYTNRAMAQAEKAILANPEVQGLFAAVGMSFGGPPNPAEGIMFTNLVHWKDRERSQQEIVQQLFGQMMAIPEALVFPINRPSLSGSRSSSDIEIVLMSSDAELSDFAEVGREIIARFGEIPGLVNIDSNLRLEDPQIDIVIDRERAADLGISVASVADALRLMVAEGPTDDFVLRNKQYDVVMSLAREYQNVPEQLDEIYVRTADGSMTPLSTVAQSRPGIGPASLAHHGLQRSATVTASLAPGANLGDVLPLALAEVDEVLPPGWTTQLGGLSREFVESGQAIYFTFGIALLIIFLVLAAQFESFLHPLTVLLSVPLACAGAFGALYLAGLTLNVFSGIGIILLVGLVTKNSILLVDFANQERARGTELVQSLIEAGKTRFRPILMTSFTSILGAVPLAFAVGAGAEARRPIGIVVVGGLVFSTAFTLVVVPVVHIFIVRLGERLGINMIPPLVEMDMEPSSTGAGRRGEAGSVTTGRAGQEPLPVGGGGS